LENLNQIGLLGNPLSHFGNENIKKAIERYENPPPIEKTEIEHVWEAIEDIKNRLDILEGSKKRKKTILEICAKCGDKALHECKRCSTSYCSEICQKNDWNQHRYLCK